MILEVEDLHAGYGRIPVLMGATLAAEETGILGILGHNGMGKTTLLRALIGQLPATQGKSYFSAGTSRRSRSTSAPAPDSVMYRRAGASFQ